MLVKKRILFMAASCGDAHLYNCMRLGKALKAKGHKIAFTIGGSQLQKAKDFGVSEIYQVLDNCYLAKSEWDLFESITERDYLEKCLAEEEEVIKRFKPDLIISDFRLTAGISAFIHNLPWVSMLAQLWYLPGYRPLLQDVYSRSGLDDISAEMIDLRFQKLAKKLNRLLRKMKVPEITDLMQIYTSPVCTLMRTIPPFTGNHSLPKNFHIVGPFFPRKFNKQPIKQIINQLRNSNININQNLKTVILRLSGLIPDKKAAENLVQAVKDKFKKTELQLLISDRDLKTTCENVLLTSYLPFDLIFQLGNIVLISNGGLNTTSQAIIWEIPQLVIPTQVENEYNAFIIKELGVGEVLFPLSKLKPEIIFENIKNLFTDQRYKLALKRAKKYFLDFPGVPAAIECMEEHHLL